MVQLIARLVLALVFVTAAFGKTLDFAGGRRALVNFGLPEGLARPGAFLLPALEALIAVGLVVTASARPSAIAALVLLLAFVVAIGRLMRAGEAPACHCFGSIHSEPVGASTLGRNAALAAIALFVSVAGAGRSLAALSSKDLAIVLLSVLAAGLAVAVLLLAREARELRKRPARRQPTGLPKGSPAPDFRLPDIAGGERGLADHLDAGRPALLTFVSPSCGPCKALMPELGRWQRTVADDLAVMVLSTGDLDENKAIAAEHEVDSLLVAPGPRVSRMYQVSGTPSAVLVDPDGTVAMTPATGAPAIEALMRIALRRTGTATPAPTPFSLPVTQG